MPYKDPETRRLKQVGYSLAYRLRHLERAREIGRRSYYLHGQTWKKKTPEKARLAYQNWVTANREKARAHWALNGAVRYGKITKPESCEKCLATGCRIEGHHHRGYAKEFWLDVLWLCCPCHNLEKRNRPFKPRSRG